MSECNCPLKGDPRTEICRESTEDVQGNLWMCSKPEGHDGPHSACNTVAHPGHVWEKAEAEA